MSLSNLVPAWLLATSNIGGSLVVAGLTGLIAGGGASISGQIAQRLLNRYEEDLRVRAAIGAIGGAFYGCGLVNAMSVALQGSFAPLLMQACGPLAGAVLVGALVSYPCQKKLSFFSGASMATGALLSFKMPRYAPVCPTALCRLPEYQLRQVIPLPLFSHLYCKTLLPIAQTQLHIKFYA